jgi:hypothetical protein
MRDDDVHCDAVHTMGNVFALRCGWLVISVLGFAVGGPARPEVTPSSAL